MDSFASFLSGLGIIGRDKSVSARATLRILDLRELSNLYRGDWLARKIVDVPAFDSCRAWRTWNADRNQIEALEATERDFGLQRKVMEGLTKSRLFGGSALVIGVDGTGEWNDELDLERVKKGSLKFVHAVERWMIPAGPRVRDITNPWFGEPEYYTRSNQPILPVPGNIELAESFQLGKQQSSDILYIHPSRVVRFIGLDYPDMEMAPDPWGDSVLQPIHDSIRDANMVSQAVAACINEMKVDVIKVPGLSNTLSTDAGAAELGARWARANAAKSVINALLIDQSEEITRLYPQLHQVPQLLQMYLLMAAAAADIPSTRLLSREPAGQNATGDSDTRNYYDRLSADQKVRLTPALSRLDEVVIRSTLGTRPDEINYDWNPLWQLDDVQKAQIGFQKAQAFKIDNDSGLIPPEVLQQARQNQLIQDDTYPGLDQTLDDYRQAMEAAAADLTAEGPQSEALLGTEAGTDLTPPEVDKSEEAATSDAMQSALAFNLLKSARRRRKPNG